MAVVEKSIEVNVPVRTAYNQWTQFETFPQFMEGVEEVQQLDDKNLHWRASIAGKTEEWDAVITEQIPDQRIAWKSTSGVENSGVVTFHHLSPTSSRITLQMGWEPRDATERAGEKMGMDDRQIEGDLERFKRFIESTGQETGAWRGEIRQGDVER